MNVHLGLKLPDGFDRDMKLLLCSLASRNLVLGFLEVVRVIYFALLGFSPIEIGFLLSIAAFAVAINSVAFGFLSDRFGRKPFLLLQGFFSIIRMIIFVYSTDFWLLALAQSVGGLGEGMGAGNPVMSGFIADKTNRRQRASIFSALALASGIVRITGSLMAGLPVYFQENMQLSMVEAHSLLFWIGVASSAASLLFITPIKWEKPKKRGKKEVEQNFLNLKSWGVIGRFSLVRMTGGVGWGLYGSLLPLFFFIRFGVGSQTMGIIYAAARFLSILSYPLIPRIVGRFGEVKTMVAVLLLASGLTVAFAMSSLYLLAVVLVIAIRVVHLFSNPIRQSFAASMVDPEETATAVGISGFLRMTSQSIAPTLAGYMFETLSLFSPFLCGAGLVLAQAMLFRVFFRDKNG